MDAGPRNRLTLVVVVLTVCLLGACGTTSTKSASPTLSTTAASPSTPAAPSSTMTIRPGTPACLAGSLTAHGGRQGGGFVGEAEGTVILTKTGSSACTLSGNPTVALIASDGSQLNVQAAPPTNAASPPVLLQSTGSATLIVYWSNWCGSRPGPLQIRITLAGNEGTLTGPFDGPPNYDFVPACRDNTQPSTLSVVHAYYQGGL